MFAMFSKEGASVIMHLNFLFFGADFKILPESWYEIYMVEFKNLCGDGPSLWCHLNNNLSLSFKNYCAIMS
jgi:hypothetical protein